MSLSFLFVLALGVLIGNWLIVPLFKGTRPSKESFIFGTLAGIVSFLIGSLYIAIA